MLNAFGVIEEHDYRLEVELSTGKFKIPNTVKFGVTMTPESKKGAIGGPDQDWYTVTIPDITFDNSKCSLVLENGGNVYSFGLDIGGCELGDYEWD